MKKIFFTLICVTWSCLLSAQGPVLQWQKTLGGDDEDLLISLQPTFDGGYIGVGYSFSDSAGDKTADGRGAEDYWVVKLDAAGNLQWQRTLGGSDVDVANGVVQTADSGYIVYGASKSDASGDKTSPLRYVDMFDCWLIKLDKDGDVVWQKTVGGDGFEGFALGLNSGNAAIAEGVPALISMDKTADGGYILGITSSSGAVGDKTDVSRATGIGAPYNLFFPDCWVVKLDAAGNIEWQKTIGGDLQDVVGSIKQTPDGGYIIGASSNSGISGEKGDSCRSGSLSWVQGVTSDPVFWDYWVIKLDDTGRVEWEKTLGGDSSDVLMRVLPDPRGGYIAGGYSHSEISAEKIDASRGGKDFWVLKLDDNGEIEWQKTIGGNDNDMLLDLKIDADGGYILAGISQSDSTGEKDGPKKGLGDYWLVKLDTAGAIEWQQIIGGSSETSLEIAVSVFQTARGDYVVGGSSSAGASGEKTEGSRGERDYWIVGLECQVDTAVTLSGNALAAAQSGAVYQWLNCSTGQPVTGATSQTFVPTENGDYALAVKLKGCVDTSACHSYDLIDDEESVSNIAAAKGISIYPNPAGSDVTVRAANSHGLRNIRLINTLGAVVDAVDAGGRNIYTLQLENLAPGIYTLQIATTGEVVSHKLEILH